MAATRELKGYLESRKDGHSRDWFAHVALLLVGELGEKRSPAAAVSDNGKPDAVERRQANGSTAQ